MSRSMTIDEMQEMVRPLQAYVGAKLKHVVQSSFYTVTGIHFRETDMSIEFTYQTRHREPVAFSRPIAELLDGRYEITLESRS